MHGLQLHALELTSQNVFHSTSHFLVVSSKALTEVLYSRSLPPTVCCTFSNLLCNFSRSLPWTSDVFAVYEFMRRQSCS